MVLASVKNHYEVYMGLTFFSFPNWIQESFSSQFKKL